MTQVYYPRHAIDDAVQDNFEAVKRVVNGELGNDNLAEDAAIDGSKIDWDTVPPDAGIGGVDIGAVVAYTGPTVPDGWLLADGSVKVRTEWPDLFDVIGATYNTGGETILQFRLPDLTSRFIYGAGSPAGSGAKGGAAQVTLDITKVPPHSHGGNTQDDDGTFGGHQHFFEANRVATGRLDGGSNVITGIANVGSGNVQAISNTPNIPSTHHHPISSEGGGLAHENMPPYILLAWIIRAIGGGSGGGGGGPPVGGDKNFVHSQSTLSSVWNIAHGLGKRCAVDVVDTGDNLILPDVHYVDDNNLSLTFAAATSGKAYCN